MYYKNLILHNLLLVTAFSTTVSNIEAKFYNEIHTLDQYNLAYQSNKPTVIMYSTPSCQPCKKTEPNFDQAAKEFNQAQFFKLDVSKSKLSSLIEKNNIQSVPVIIYSKDGKEYKRDRRGAMSFNEIKQSVEQFLNSTENTKSTNKSKNTIRSKNTKKSSRSKNRKRKCPPSKCR